MKLKFKCEGCGKTLTASGNESGETLPCPKCGTMLVVPFGGIGILPYAAMFLMSFGAFFLVMSAGAPRVTVWLAFAVFAFLNYQRALNIGHSERICAVSCGLALVPLTFFYFVARETGAAKRNAGAYVG